jgi:hypothetical protein
VSAWQPDMDGNFRSWSSDLLDGRHFVATASGGSLSKIAETEAGGSVTR